MKKPDETIDDAKEQVILSLEEAKASLDSEQEKEILEELVSRVDKTNTYDMNSLSADLIRIFALLPRLINDKNRKLKTVCTEVLKPEKITLDDLSHQLFYGPSVEVKNTPRERKQNSPHKK